MDVCVRLCCIVKPRCDMMQFIYFCINGLAHDQLRGQTGESLRAPSLQSFCLLFSLLFYRSIFSWKISHRNTTQHNGNNSMLLLYFIHSSSLSLSLSFWSHVHAAHKNSNVEMSCRKTVA